MSQNTQIGQFSGKIHRICRDRAYQALSLTAAAPLSILYQTCYNGRCKGGTVMELQKGRPADTAGRLEKEIRTYDLLDRLGVEYERVDHAPAMTMEVCQEIDQTLHAVICKNLFL